jgi:hypothetical protein
MSNAKESATDTLTALVSNASVAETLPKFLTENPSGFPLRNLPKIAATDTLTAFGSNASVDETLTKIAMTEIRKISPIVILPGDTKLQLESNASVIETLPFSDDGNDDGDDDGGNDFYETAETDTLGSDFDSDSDDATPNVVTTQCKKRSSRKGLKIPEAQCKDGNNRPPRLSDKDEHGPFKCVNCGLPVFLYRESAPDKIRHVQAHFAHRSKDGYGPRVPCGGEGLFHWSAKMFVAANICRLIFHRSCKDCKKEIAWFSPSKDVYGEPEESKRNVVYRKSSDGKRRKKYIVDVMVRDSNDQQIAAIEIWKSHQISADKRQTLETKFGKNRVYEVRAEDVMKIKNGEIVDLEDKMHPHRCDSCQELERLKQARYAARIVALAEHAKLAAEKAQIENERRLEQKELERKQKEKNDLEIYEREQLKKKQEKERVESLNAKWFADVEQVLKDARKLERWSKLFEESQKRCIDETGRLISSAFSTVKIRDSPQLKQLRGLHKELCLSQWFMDFKRYRKSDTKNQEMIDRGNVLNLSNSNEMTMLIAHRKHIQTSRWVAYCKRFKLQAYIHNMDLLEVKSLIRIGTDLQLEKSEEMKFLKNIIRKVTGWDWMENHFARKKK